MRSGHVNKVTKRLESCKSHLHHLNHLLDRPVCLTRSALRPEFPSGTGLKIAHVEDLKKAAGQDPLDVAASVAAKTADIAMLMLTSGSTDKPKAVCLTHQQIMASLTGKCAVLPVDAGSSFLNWIRLDHVGSLVEIHLHSMFAGTDQIHVEPSDFISEP
ncbi:Thioesterase domain protein, partial [Aspergillus sclerotialis]